MARLDGSIERLYRSSALELVLQTGKVPFLRLHKGEQEILRQPLNAAQIVAACAEILPEALRPNFPRDGTTRFAYTGPHGTVGVRFDKWTDKVRLAITPALSDDEAGLFAVEPDAPGTAGNENVERAADGPSMPIPKRKPRTAEAETAAETTPSVAAPPPAMTIHPVPKVPLLVAPQHDANAEMRQLLSRMISSRASDLHASAGRAPMMRIDGDMTPVEGYPALQPDRLKALLWSIAPDRCKEQWEQTKDTDFAFETELARFRVNVFADRGGIGTVIRQIPTEILTAKDLGLSKQILELCALPKGLVLVTGPTGSGKSTTLAAMIDHINRTRNDHIITIEDPIEFVHKDLRCLVNQREVGSHTGSFKAALKAALREDPDVILVGELRDLESIAIALETAETGHLVFGTLHTNTAPSTVDRIVDQFPSDRQSQVRTMLAESLKGVVAQTLCKKIGGGRVAAQEVLLSNSAVSNIIREGKNFQLPSAIQTGRAQGMIALNDALLELVKANLVTPDEALKKAVARAEFKAALQNAGFKFGAPARPTAAAAAAAA